MSYGATGYQSGNKIPSGYKQGTMQNFTPEQMKLFKQLFSNLGPDSYLARLAAGEEGIFDEIEAPAFRQFGELQGDISSRFSGMGMGGRHGSGFQNEMNTAASNFAQDLQAQRMGLRNQALKDLMGMSSDLLGQRPQENFLVQKQQKKSGWGGAIGAGAGALGASYFGMDPLKGAKFGYQVGSGF